MTKCKNCGSFAINHNHHGRDGSDGDLCDVCYWRKRAGDIEATSMELAAEIDRLKRAVKIANELLDLEGPEDAETVIDQLRQQLADAQLHNEQLREFVKKVAEQTPEKPDYWSSCSQCQGNSNDAEDLITTKPDLSALEAERQMVAEACAKVCGQRADVLDQHSPNGIAADYFTRGAQSAAQRNAAAIRAGQWLEHLK